MLQERVWARDDLVVASRPHLDRGRDVRGEDIATLFDLLDSNDTDAIMGFLEAPKEMGIDPLVVIIDMWKTYRTTMAKVLPGTARTSPESIDKFFNSSSLLQVEILPRDEFAESAAVGRCPLLRDRVAGPWLPGQTWPLRRSPVPPQTVHPPSLPR